MFKSSQTLRDIFWAYSLIRDKIEDSRERNDVFILFTGAAPYTRDNLLYWVRINEIMREIFEAGAVIVVPAGNYARSKDRSQQIDTIPARWSSPTFPLIVVGAVDSHRFRAPFSQAPDKVNVYAPGVDVVCANNPKASGTSYASALVRSMSSSLQDESILISSFRLRDYWLTISV